ncbi:MAG TPA: MmgE/PrpD family protein [Clostridia bacterium]|nr:MmgE/PrpD family protein [Clostridia bacterium]
MARFISETTFEDIPERVRSRVKLCVLDTIGCGLFGSTLPWGKIVWDWASEWAGKPVSSVFGRSRRLPPALAALVNGTMIHGFEMDDLHKESIVHLGAVTFPAALALAETLDQCSGAQLLSAVCIGYEVGARVGSSIGTSHLLRGFHPTGTSGTFASGAAAAKVMGFDVDLTRHTIGIAATQGAGLMSAQYSAMVKRMHAGRAAQAGVYAATLAQRGFTGIENVIEAEYGGFCSTMADSHDLARITRAIGHEWEAEKITFKPYPCCGSVHTALDGLIEIVNEEGIDYGDVEKVRVQVSSVTKKHVGWEYRPDSVTSAQMNMYYCLAALLTEGRLTVEQFTPERISDPRILDRVRDISVEVSPTLDALGPLFRHSVIVEVSCRDGRNFEKRVDHSRGSPQKPMSDADIVDKFMTNARAAGWRQAEDIKAAVMGLEDLGDVLLLAGLIRGYARTD